MDRHLPARDRRQPPAFPPSADQLPQAGPAAPHAPQPRRPPCMPPPLTSMPSKETSRSNARAEKPTGGRAGWAHHWQSRWSQEPGRKPLKAVPCSWQATVEHFPPDPSTCSTLQAWPLSIVRTSRCSLSPSDETAFSRCVGPDRTSWSLWRCPRASPPCRLQPASLPQQSVLPQAELCPVAWSRSSTPAGRVLPECVETRRSGGCLCGQGVDLGRVFLFGRLERSVKAEGSHCFPARAV